MKAFLNSLITPGLGYLRAGNKKSFYKTIIFFFATLIIGIQTRIIITFWGFVTILILLAAIYIFALTDVVLKKSSNNIKVKSTGYLKILFVLSFFLITGLSFANRRRAMGFDIMRMAVPVMQPTILPGDRFLINTWAYKRSLPKKGDIIAHTFNEQEGIYLNRIVATENDKIEIGNGSVFVNGQIVHEPYVLPANVIRPQSRVMKPLIIPKGHYFVMGDNRDASFGDSRFSGTITMQNIVGKTTDVISSSEWARVGITLK